MRTGTPLVLGLFPLFGLLVHAGDADLAKLKEKPITAAQGKVGELLRQWWKEGTAAGNAGDFYDNRDGSHSDLDMGPFPQLQKIVYSPDDIKIRRHWAAQRVLLPHVTFGNSSTSAPPTSGGSNPRQYYCSTQGLSFLYKQYTGNNVYIYPEHRDHDPGHNGRNDGFGDLYPTNTPYLIISQGSSGSDQPFMRAIPFTLAAFRPEVKKKLADGGLLMPTLQMILRRTSRLLKDPGDYLTTRAHPTVFEGSAVDDLAMVRLAHDMQADNLPPMVQLKVLEEEQPVRGKDFFDMPASEKLADTPAVIARIFRGKDQQRRMVVSAAGSYDLDKKPLTFTWVVLRGDPERVKIVPRGQDQAEAEIVVSYPQRRPIAPGSAMESNRVDVGVFAHNGTYHSTPAFITWYSLDSEARAYDDKGRLLEIGYGMSETSFNVSNWSGFLEKATGDGQAGKLLKASKNSEHWQVFRAALPQVQTLEKAHAAAQANTKAAEEARKLAVNDEDKKKAETFVQTRQKEQAAANKALSDFLDGKTKDAPQAVRALADQFLQTLAGDPNLWGSMKKVDGELVAGLEGARKRLIGLGIASEDKAKVFRLTPLRPNSWTAFEKAQIARFNAAIIASEIFPGTVTSSHQVNFVDQRLTVPRDWRDVYRHDADAKLLGWTRFDGKETLDFTADGLLVVEKDDRGRPIKGRTVTYVQDPGKGFGLNANPLRMVAGEIVTIEERK